MFIAGYYLFNINFSGKKFFIAPRIYCIPLLSPTSEIGDNISVNFLWQKFINFIIILVIGELFKEITTSKAKSLPFAVSIML
jgi:hypothetical protein